MWSELLSNKSFVHPQNEEYGPVATQNHLTFLRHWYVNDLFYDATGMDGQT